VQRGARAADVILGTYPAGYRLTDAAVEEIATLFDKLNPSGRNWSITNNCLAVIRRVPVWQAEEVAGALVLIAKKCTGDCGNSAVSPGQQNEDSGGEAGREDVVIRSDQVN